MKKLICTLLLVCLLGTMLVSCNGSKYNEALDLMDEGNYEDAREILEELGDYKDAEELLENFQYVLTSMEVDYGHDGFSTAVHYNDKDQSLQIVFTYLDGNNEIFDYVYANGKLTKEICTKENGQKTIRDYTYDKDGNLTKEINTDHDGDVHIYEYFYDANNNCIKEVHSAPDASKYITDLSYDINNNLVKKVDTFPSGAKNVLDCSYNTRNLLIRKVATSFLGGQTVYTYLYDEADNLIKTTTSFSGNTDEEINYTYDENGNLLEEEVTYLNGNKEIINYTYDTKGNLAKEIGKTYNASVSFWTTDYTYEFAYDENGNMIKQTLEEDGDKATVVYTYNLLYVSVDFPEDFGYLTAKLDQ